MSLGLIEIDKPISTAKLLEVRPSRLMTVISAVPRLMARSAETEARCSVLLIKAVGKVVLFHCVCDAAAKFKF